MALPTQKFANLLDMLGNNAEWAADHNVNVAFLKDAFRTFKIVIDVNGSTGVASQVSIQLQDATGTVNIAEQFYIRVRVVNNGGYTNATNATIGMGVGTSTVETFTATKDLVVQSDATGKVKLLLTCGVASTFQLLIGSTVLSPMFANFNNSQAVTHV